MTPMAIVSRNHRRPSVCFDLLLADWWGEVNRRPAPNGGLRRLSKLAAWKQEKLPMEGLVPIGSSGGSG